MRRQSDLAIGERVEIRPTIYAKQVIAQAVGIVLVLVLEDWA
jgi:hypothetical protein